MGEDRISRFLSAIERYSKEQQKALKAKFNDIRKNELHMAEAEALRDAYYLIQDEMVKMNKEIDGSISRAELENRRTLIGKRSEIKRSVFEVVKCKLMNFTKSIDGYLNFLDQSVKKIERVLSYSGTILFVKPEDLKFSENLKEMFGRTVTVKAKESILIGGVFGMNQKMGMIVDETLDEKLKEEEEYFIQMSGLKII